MIKSVSFKKKEKDMVSFIRGKDFSYYVKGLIQKDMEEYKKLHPTKQDLNNKDM